jgi:hypothetical protein
MSKENRASQSKDVVATLQQVRTLVDECIAGLAGKPLARSRKEAAPSRLRKLQPRRSLDFSANVRAFVKAHAKDLNGGRKFTLLLAYLAKGEANKEIQLKDIETTWDRMTSLLGKFNRKYSNDAKELGSVDTKKQGVYVLRPQWRELIAEQ